MIEVDIKMPPDPTPELVKAFDGAMRQVRKDGLKAVYDEAPVGRGRGQWYRHRGKAIERAYGTRAVYSFHQGHMRDDDLSARRSGMEIAFKGQYRARFVNDGTSPHIIPVRYRDRAGKTRKRNIPHPGARANPFFERALDEDFLRQSVDTFVQRMDEGVWR